MAIPAVVLLAIAGCAPTSSARKQLTAPATQEAPSTTVHSSTSATTQFAALTLRHPRSWRAYLTPNGADLPNGDGAYLTDEPTSARCTSTSAGSTSPARCADDTDFPLGPKPGRVWIEVAVSYAPLDHRAREDLDIDGYRAQVDASASDATGFPADSEGFPVPWCSLDSDYAVQVTATARTTAIQPSSVMVTACFGTQTGPARRAFRAMLGTATITTRPSQTAPVAGAPRCTHDDLRLHYNQQGSNQSVIASYAFTNRGRVTCQVGGYPRLVLRTARGGTTGNIRFRHVGGVHELFLRSGSSVEMTTQAFSHSDAPVRTYATTEWIYLPGIPEPFVQRFPRGAFPILSTAQIDVSPLNGD